jgi:hypothetical protein
MSLPLSLPLPLSPEDIRNMRRKGKAVITQYNQGYNFEVVMDKTKTNNILGLQLVYQDATVIDTYHNIPEYRISRYIYQLTIF